MHKETAYIIVRMAIGLSMFGHGLVRIPKLEAFSNGIIKTFENSMLPEFLVIPFSYVLPFAELIFGLLLILGLFTRVAAIATSIVLLSLVFGSTLIESWGNITSQLIHIAFLVFVIQNIEENTYAIDNIIKQK
ncbi:DoxX family membrane protein [Joostella atrarenae]|uniref:DoxX family membrane protein n=1 Tax=Joostella atrarenae TaxID=679257 RepID=A0ABS9J1Y4_9FLAO|nr:DoxX family membrane protein [Joostella atrarenae]MCF8714432.1 DoxX family membrane protein [Joostella atrarenae]